MPDPTEHVAMVAHGRREEAVHEPATAARIRSTGAGSLSVRFAAFAVWAAFVVFCLGLSFSRGLCCADDGWYAITARNIATGVGYRKPLESPAQTAPTTTFDPPIGAGPTLILPAALLLGLVGVNEVVPGVAAVLLWAAALTVLLARLGRKVPGGRFLAAVLVFLFAILAVFPYHFEQWHAFLGEIPAAALSLLALWVAATERLTARSLLTAGLLLGLSFQAKLLTLLVAPAFFAVLAWRLRSARAGWRESGRLAALASAGCVLPTALFESVKLLRLGAGAYAAETLRFLYILRDKGLGVGRAPLLSVLGSRIELIHDRFAVHPLALVVLAGLAVLVWTVAIEERWRPLFLGLAVSIASLGVYWLVLSIGWPRYLVIAVFLACFAASVPVFAARTRAQRAIFALVAVPLLAGGLARLPFVLGGADNGLFHPSNERLARARVLSLLETLLERPPVTLCSLGWASAVDVQFGLPAGTRFVRFDTAKEPAGRTIVLINKRFVSGQEALVEAARARAADTLLVGGPYELLEIAGPGDQGEGSPAHPPPAPGT